MITPSTSSGADMWMMRALPDKSIKSGRMVDPTTLDTKIAGTTKSLHCFPPKSEKFEMATVKHIFGCRIAKNVRIFMIWVYKPMFMRSRNSINYVLNIFR